MSPFFLWAAPAAPAAPPPAVDPLNALYALIAVQVLVGAVALGFGIVRWMAGRTVAREDQDKEALRSDVDELQENEKKTERALGDLLHSLDRFSLESKTLHGSVEATRASITEVKSHVDARIEKQAEHYRQNMKDFMADVTEKLEALEFQLRQDTTRAIHDAQAMSQRKRKP